MCNFKQYLDRQYAVEFLHDNGRDDLAGIYRKIAEIVVEMGILIPQDFSAVKVFEDQGKLKPYCDMLLEICTLEEKASKLVI